MLLSPSGVPVTDSLPFPAVATVHQSYPHHATQLHAHQPQPATTPTGSQPPSQHAAPSPVQVPAVGHPRGWGRGGWLKERTRTQSHSLLGRTWGSEVVPEVALTVSLALMPAPGRAGPTPGQWTAAAEPVPPRGPDRHAAFSATGTFCPVPSEQLPPTSRCICHPCPPAAAPRLHQHGPCYPGKSPHCLP